MVFITDDHMVSCEVVFLVFLSFYRVFSIVSVTEWWKKRRAESEFYWVLPGFQRGGGGMGELARSGRNSFVSRSTNERRAKEKPSNQRREGPPHPSHTSHPAVTRHRHAMASWLPFLFGGLPGFTGFTLGFASSSSGFVLFFLLEFTVGSF